MNWKTILVVSIIVFILLCCKDKDYFSRIYEDCGYGEARIEVTSSAPDFEELRKLSSGMPNVVGRVLMISSNVFPESCETFGLVKLSCDKSQWDQLAALHSGDIVDVKGVFVQLSEDLSGFDYGASLRSVGISAVCQISEMKIVKSSSQTSWRERMIRRFSVNLLRGMPLDEEPGICQMLVALGIGGKAYMSSNDKQMLARAGVIHAFAISGMHVGIVAGIILCMLKCLFCPLRIRWLFAMAGIVLYVAMTGFSPSAVRAMLMALLMFCSWLAWRPFDALNALAIAAGCAMASCPDVIWNLGFVYSYMVVFALVFAWPGIISLQSAMFERWNWLPRCKRDSRHLLRKVAGAVISVFCVSLLAWFTCAGISLYHGTRLCLISPILNLPVAVLLPLILLLCLIKMLTGAACLAAPLVWMMKTLRVSAEMAAESTWCLKISQISGFEMQLYYLAWIIVLIALRKLGRTAEKY